METNVPLEGEFVEIRGRKWLVEGRQRLDWGLDTVRLACVDDDAQGEPLEVAWSAEIGAKRLQDDAWATLGRAGTDDPLVFSAYLRTVRWNTATAAERDLFQAPFRAGIRLDAYQLLPLRKALRLSRVNLLIADDTGLGKTVEAGLILRELLLRRRIDFTLVTAPASMTNQWKDELEAKFGLAFTIIDRNQVAEVRRKRGFSANPWAVGSRFIVSHNLIAEEAYAAGLRDLLGDLRARSLLIVDEAHHAAPASGRRYAVDSQFTRSIRALAQRFEHRLFLSATPHNGHSNSFTALLEMLDPQRFIRGQDIRPGDLDPVMVRRLKSDLRLLGEPFPERIVKPIPIVGLPDVAPELVLARKLREYGDLRDKRLAQLPAREAAMAKLVFSGLQQRLLSSIAAFASTLGVHRKSLSHPAGPAAAAARQFAAGALEPDEAEPTDEQSAQISQEQEEEAAAAAATTIGLKGSSPGQLQAELDLVDDMLRIAEQHQNRPDARVRWIADWVRANMISNGAWNDRRLILFTEWEVTRRWLERRLKEALDDLDPEPRVAVFTGLTTTDRREVIKRAFNTDPAQEPLRILICTDAAREGINLQAHCHDLIHIDLPWNPARLEQRNGRIDRKLQPSPKVWCRYFVFEQREEDIVLDALVRKTERIQNELGSIGQVIADRLQREGIRRARELAAEVEAEDGGERPRTARAEMDDEDERRRGRLMRDLDDLRNALERSRERVGVDPDELQAVVGIALQRAGTSLDTARAGAVNGTPLFHLDPDDAAFRDPGWSDVFDDMRERPRKRGERPAEWRAKAAIRQIAFKPPILPDQTDATGVVQLHLEHRLVRRLLARFLSQGFQSGLQRVSVITGPGAQPRVLLLGRLALFGPGAARLHEEIIPVTALWIEATRGTAPLRPLAERGQETTMSQLDAALKDPRRPSAAIRERVRGWAWRDARDLEPELRRRAEARQMEAQAALARRGEEQAKSLGELLQQQRQRIVELSKKGDDPQLMLPGLDAEREQLRRDHAHRERRLAQLEAEIMAEPKRVRERYEVRATRLEPVGLVYLWPATN